MPDFADANDFRITAHAQAVIDRQKAIIDNASSATPAEPKPAEAEKKLKQSGAILEDLRDD